MTSEQFVYWLQGFLELKEAGSEKIELDEAQIKCIKDHINLVLTKVTPANNIHIYPQPQPLIQTTDSDPYVKECSKPSKSSGGMIDTLFGGVL